MRIGALISATFLAMLLWSGGAVAQGGTAEVEALQKELQARKDAMAEMNREIVALRAEKEQGYADVIKSYHKSYTDFFNYQNDLRDHAQSILDWQLFSSYALLFVVVVVTGLGVTLSFMETRMAIRMPSRLLEQDAGTDGNADTANAAKDSGNGNTRPVNTVELSWQKLQITSAVTGVVILVISLAFLYLFVDRVLGLEPTDFTSILEPGDPDKTKPEAETAG